MLVKINGSRTSFNPNPYFTLTLIYPHSRITLTLIPPQPEFFIIDSYLIFMLG